MAGNKAFDFWKTQEEGTKGTLNPTNTSKRTDASLPMPRNASFHVSGSTNSSDYPRRSFSTRTANASRPVSYMGQVSGSSTLGPVFESSSTWYTTFTDRGERVVSHRKEKLDQMSSTQVEIKQKKCQPSTPQKTPLIHVLVTEDVSAPKVATSKRMGSVSAEKPTISPKPPIDAKLKRKLGHTASLAPSTTYQASNVKVTSVQERA